MQTKKVKPADFIFLIFDHYIAILVTYGCGVQAYIVYVIITELA
jgi:hypothetical protein